MTTLTIQHLLFLDFEASSLSANSWPIEVGFAWIEGGKAHQEARLIQPDASWDPLDWSDQSEAIHNIPRTLLQSEGISAWDAATWALGMMDGKVVVSDNPRYEAFWLAKLLDAQPKPIPKGLQVHDYDATLGQFLQTAGRDGAFEALERAKRPHRAGEDARILAEGLLAGLEVDAGTRPLRP